MGTSLDVILNPRPSGPRKNGNQMNVVSNVMKYFLIVFFLVCLLFVQRSDISYATSVLNISESCSRTLH